MLIYWASLFWASWLLLYYRINNYNKEQFWKWHKLSRERERESWLERWTTATGEWMSIQLSCCSKWSDLNIFCNGTACFKNVNNCLNPNNSYLETSCGQSSNLYFDVVHFSTPVLIRYLRQLNIVVFLHWCLLCTVLLIKKSNVMNDMKKLNCIFT